jgi:hypothetical protein
MSFSDNAETLVLNWVFTSSSATRPTAWYLALFTTDPTDADTGTEVSTVGTAYARESVTFTVSGDTASNTAAVEFATATASYGTVSHVGVYDAVTGGNLIAHAALSTAKTIDTGDVLRLPAGELDITLA